jgi:DNA-binding response OmpR family regulator
MARILVVEDDADSRRLIICHPLKRAGHVAEEAATGEGVLRHLSEAEYDLVMLDVVLPGISGWQVAWELASYTGSHVPRSCSYR